MEMPDVIYAAEYFDIDTVSLKEWREKSLTGSEKYYHSRIVEGLKADNEELKNSIEILGQKLRDYSKAIDRLDAKLEKAKDIIIDMEKSDDAQAFKEARKFIDTHCSRTTLGELTKK